MGDILSSLGTDVMNVGQEALGGLEGIGNSLFGQGGLVSQIGSDIGGLFGQGGPAGLTAADSAATSVAPSAVGGASDAMAAAGMAPAAAGGAAAMGTGPGIGAGMLATDAGNAVTAPQSWGDALSPAMVGTAGVDTTSQPWAAPGVAAGAGAGAGASPVFAQIDTGGAVTPFQGSNFLQSVLKNPHLMKELTGLGLFGTEMLTNRSPPGLKDIQALEKQQAGFAVNQGRLAQAEQQGILPEGAQSLVQRTYDAQKAAIHSKYNQLGMPGSTAELDELNALKANRDANLFQIGNQMATQGYSNMQAATGVQSDLLQQIMLTEMLQKEQFRQAMSNLAASFAS